KLAMTPPSNVAEQPTPPKRHGGLGNLLNAAMNPMGAAVDQASENAADHMAQNMMGPAMGASMQMMNMLRNGHVVRYTYYWSKSWVREEDPVAQTATISKCRQHQFITLDLAKKTYRISDTTPKGCDTMPQQSASRSAPTVRNEAPGTVDMTVSANAKSLGPKTLDGVHTNGSNHDFQMAMTNATGSCHNGAMLMTMTSYVSGIRKPRAYCPLVTPKYVASEPGDIVRGGCKPTFKATASGNVMNRSSDFLEMYVLTSMSGGDTIEQARANAGKFNQLLERGNVAFLYRTQADPLFEIPPGFTEMK
ncbi:MAG TPA: hypothetical protein VFN49_11475, partial [Candidatus Aquilonibacter sp.]|nr:hypothetical protein [Candidatus Aquilonibacter sp.]